MEGFVFSTEIAISVADVADNSRVRSAKYLDYFLDALLKWFDVMIEEYDLEPVAATEARYELNCPAPLMAPVGQPRKAVAVGNRVSRVGNSSYTVESEFRDGERVVAELTCALIVIDPTTGKSAPISEKARRAFVAAHEAAGIPIDA